MRIFTLILLLILGISAVGGGWMLITDPSGISLGIPSDLLKETPFNDYLIPGIILFIFNGVLSLITAILMIKKSKYFTFFLIFQGLFLSTWLTVELILNLDFYTHHLHLPLYLMSIIFIGSGYKLMERK